MFKGLLYLGLAVLAFMATVRMGTYSYHLYKQGAASQEWVETEAVVSKFEIPPGNFSSGNLENPTAYVTYHYDVYGQSYTGERLGFGPYSKGQLVQTHHGRATIYYDPNDPKESLYIKGISRPNTYFLGVVGLVLVIGLLFLWLAIKRLIRL